jgi:predicted dehydrogenase
MARQVSECCQIIRACEKTDVLLMVALMKRFDPAFLLVRQFIDSRELGEVYEIGSDWPGQQAAFKQLYERGGQ